MIRRIQAISLECLAMIRGQWVISLVVVLLIAGSCTTVVLTTGRTAGTAQSVLDSLDAAGTRAITVKAGSGDGGALTPTDVRSVEVFEGIDWSGALGKPVEVRNSAIPSGARVAARPVFAEDLSPFGIEPSARRDGRTAYLNAAALHELSFTAPSGAVENQRTGIDYSVAGTLSEEFVFESGKPTIVIPGMLDAESRIEAIVLIAHAPSHVKDLTEAIAGALDAGPRGLKIETSAQIAELRGAVEERLSAGGQALVAGTFALTSLLVASVQIGLVLLRRRDYGRRRALGATRSLIGQLVLGQSAMLSILGACFGVAIGSVILGISGQPLPSADFLGALALLAFMTGVSSGVAPAWIASRRDPIRELRVP